MTAYSDCVLFNIGLGTMCGIALVFFVVLSLIIYFNISETRIRERLYSVLHKINIQKEHLALESSI